jgi:hypothetical protein
MAQAKKPSHDVFIVEEYGQDQSYWSKIGVAWKHEHGDGLNLQIKPGLAVSGKIVVRPVKEKKTEE